MSGYAVSGKPEFFQKFLTDPAAAAEFARRQAVITEAAEVDRRWRAATGVRHATHPLIVGRMPGRRV